MQYDSILKEQYFDLVNTIRLYFSAVYNTLQRVLVVSYLLVDSLRVVNSVTVCLEHQATSITGVSLGWDHVFL